MIRIQHGMHEAQDGVHIDCRAARWSASPAGVILACFSPERDKVKENPDAGHRRAPRSCREADEHPRDRSRQAEGFPEAELACDARERVCGRGDVRRDVICGRGCCRWEKTRARRTWAARACGVRAGGERRPRGGCWSEELLVDVAPGGWIERIEQ